jgi:hypothetical protein
MKGKSMRKTFTNLETAELLARAKSGESLEAIAESFRVTEQQIKKRLRYHEKRNVKKKIGTVKFYKKTWLHELPRGTVINKCVKCHSAFETEFSITPRNSNRICFHCKKSFAVSISHNVPSQKISHSYCKD